MQLGIQFSLLLASVLVLFSGVEAAPTTKRAGTVTLPLKRITQARDDIHPQMVCKFQVHLVLREIYFVILQ